MRTLVPGVTVKGQPCLIVQHSAQEDLFYVTNCRKLGHHRRWLRLEQGGWVKITAHKAPYDWYRYGYGNTLQAIMELADPRPGTAEDDLHDQGGIDGEGISYTGRDGAVGSGGERAP